MKSLLTVWNWKYTLVLVVFLLGALATVVGSPYRGNRVSLNTQELAVLVQKGADHVSALQLADWIIQGKSDYRLIDLGTSEEFASYHIPTAENVPLAALSEYPLLRNEKIVLYSEGGIHSAQAWFLLVAEGYRSVYMLMGGLDEWKENILFPSIPESATAEQKAAFEKMKHISRYFGGNPQVSGEEERVAAKNEMPKLEMPAKSATSTPVGKKKKEGC